MNGGSSCIFRRSQRKYFTWTWFYATQFSWPLSGCCNQFRLFSQDLAFLWWTRGGGGQLVRGRFFQKSVQTRSARMGLIRLQIGPGWEREWVWTTFLTSVAPVHPPAGNGSEYQNNYTFWSLLYFCSTYSTLYLHILCCTLFNIIINYSW